MGSVTGKRVSILNIEHAHFDYIYLPFCSSDTLQMVQGGA